ncbi:MAG TPA: chemotaxis protein CheA [Polyangiaceae bacterium]|nr:chemotaxis protein CheA [Polyangiaceae bacterium]
MALRDADTIELFAGFLQESNEGLDQVDQILLEAEQRPATPEQINHLFRVFHTIKGVSAFLGADDVKGLAHVTETLLGRIRDGVRELSGRELAVVFEATAQLRRLLGVLHTAVENDQEIPLDAATASICERIEKVTTSPVEEAPAPAPADDESPKDEASEPAAAKGQGGRIRETVKVDLERIDSVVEMIGELIIVESMITNADEVRSVASLRFRNYLGQLSKISRDLQSIAMRMRMVPVRGVFQKMARLVRDLSLKTGKSVRLVQVGEATEMDRSMVERIEDPLVHMIRNAIDHAIETSDVRRAAGKPEQGTIMLSARHEGGSVVIELTDDGRGLSRDGILKKARERGLVGENAEQLPDSDVHALIFLPGFSTAASVSELSGRGVGMDVVKRNVESLRGRVLLSSVLGSGTTFKLVLPLTLAIIDGMLVSVGDERYIIPSLAIVESLLPSESMVRVLGRDRELVNVRGEIFPLQRLKSLFEVPGGQDDPEQARIVVVESGGRKIGLMVDDVLTQQQVVIKPLSGGIGNAELLSGAAILSDGRVGLILNVDRMSELFGASTGARRETSENAA